jgi:hypothetical protein
MNINSPEDSLAAWETEHSAVLSDPDMPSDEKARVLHEIDDRYAQIHDVVTDYFEARFMRIM